MRHQVPQVPQPPNSTSCGSDVQAHEPVEDISHSDPDIVPYSHRYVIISCKFRSVQVQKSPLSKQYQVFRNSASKVFSEVKTDLPVSHGIYMYISHIQYVVA